MDEAKHHVVVVGAGGRLVKEADLDRCRFDDVPVLRRSSGGGTVLQGPGCLSFSLVLRIDRHPEIRSLVSTNRFVLDRHRDTHDIRRRTVR